MPELAIVVTSKELWHSLEKKGRNGEATVSKFYVVLVPDDPTMQDYLLYIDVFVLFFRKISLCFLLVWFFIVVLCGSLILVLPSSGLLQSQKNWSQSTRGDKQKQSSSNLVEFSWFHSIFSVLHMHSLLAVMALRLNWVHSEAFLSFAHELKGPGSLESTVLLESIYWFDPYWDSLFHDHKQHLSLITLWSLW